MRGIFGLLAVLFYVLSFGFAFSACDANGVTVNMPYMNVAVVLAIVAFITQFSFHFAPSLDHPTYGRRWFI